jgi:threonine aldolase
VDDDLEQYRNELRKRSRPVSGHGAADAAAELARVADWCVENDVDQDTYGEGTFIEAFESRLATMFGHDAARFLPTGTMAQGVAMRIWCGAGGHFGMHPTCHLELHEQRAYSHLLGLRATLVGPTERPMLAEDLSAVTEPLDALIIELPTRENGGQLPSWQALVELCGLARERGTKLHLDGARVWEAQAGFERSFAEIGALFDSVYVSFYKGIGALPGSMLIGPADVIGQAKLWQRRMGGNLFTMVGNVASAAGRLDRQLTRFPQYLERARSLANALAGIDGLRVVPDPPQVDMMHLLFDRGVDDTLAARDRVAEDTGLWLFGGARADGLADRSRIELTVGEATLELDEAEIVAAFAALLAGL